MKLYKTFESFLNEASGKEVTKKDWEKADPDQREQWLSGAIKDYDEVEKLVDATWDQLPDVAIANMTKESVINEATNYYSMEFARKQNKDIYDYKEKVMDMAEDGMKWLKDALKEVEGEPGAFDVKDFGFAFAGNAAFVLVKFADDKKRAQLSARAHAFEIQDIKGFKDYFDLETNPSIAGSSAAKEYDMAFRIKI